MKSYNLEDATTNRHLDLVIIVMYYFFTTLSTVGFGDLHPQNDEERVLSAILMLGGNAIFSLIMAQFLDLLSLW